MDVGISRELAVPSYPQSMCVKRALHPNGHDYVLPGNETFYLYFMLF